jgi:hypothetical protein
MMKLSEQRQKVDRKMRVFVGGVLKALPIVFINILALFIIGLDNFIEGSWDWARFASADFWYAYLSYQTANWLIGITFLVTLIKGFKANVDEYLNNLKAIQVIVDEDHEKPFITKQCEIETLIRKKETLEADVYKKMFRIVVKHNIKSIEAFLDNTDMITLKWRERRAYRKLERLREMLSDEWQKDYLKSHKVNIPRVTRSLITSGFVANQKYGQYNSYRTNVVSTSSQTITPSVLTSSLIGLILLSFDFLPKTADVTTWLAFVAKIFLITWNTMVISSTAYTIFSRTYLRSSEERASDLKMMRMREAKGNITVPQVVIEIVNKAEVV